MKPKIYSDISVSGGYFNKSFETASHRLIKTVKTNEPIGVVLDLTLLELQTITASRKIIGLE